LKKVVVVTSIAVFSVAFYQAENLRKKYLFSTKLEPPSGPHSGLEKWKSKFHKIKNSLKDEKDDVIEKTAVILRDLKLRFSQSVGWKERIAVAERMSAMYFKERVEQISSSKLVSLPKLSSRKIKLIIIGDSLVCGVGCDGSGENKTSPVLPSIIAKVLSVGMRSDVEWTSLGIIGGTVTEIREKLLPQLRRKMISDLGVSKKTNCMKNKKNHISNDDVEIIVIVICGLNDWKKLIENFPFGTGPITYKQDLGKLIDEIKGMGGDLSAKLKVFLPAIPLILGKGDPSCSIGIAPLTYFVDYVSWMWDEQKRQVALDNEQSTRYIAAPNSIKKIYATPGLGNFSSDGVHPSSQGYKWWAFHIAEEILASSIDERK